MTAIFDYIFIVDICKTLCNFEIVINLAVTGNVLFVFFPQL